MRKQFRQTGVAILKQYASLFRNRNFLMLWLSSAISYIGDFFNSVALVKVLSEDPEHLGLWMALVMIAKVVPGILLGPVAGVVADRFPRRTVMIIADLLRAGLVAGLVFAATPAAVITLCALAAAVSTFYNPAASALLPSLVKPEELVSAGSLSMITQRLAMLIGNGLGAVAMMLMGAHYVFLIDSASFLISAAFKLALVVPAIAAAASAAGEAKSLASRFGSDLKEAWDFVRHTPTVRRLSVTFAIFAFPDSALNVLMVTFFTIELGLAAEKMGLVFAALGGAAVVGALAIGAVGGKVHWKHLISYGAAYIWACMMGTLIVRDFLPATAFLVLLGLGSGAINVGAQAAFGLLIPDQVRGRFFGGWGMVNNLIYVVGTLLAGWLSDLVGAGTTMMGFTTFYLLAGIYAWFAFRHEGARAPAAVAAAD